MEFAIGSGTMLLLVSGAYHFTSSLKLKYAPQSLDYVII